MFVLLEKPSTTEKFGLLARKNGKYTRPIVGELVDFRVEDFMPQQLLVKLHTPHFIGRLPDIPEIGQHNSYFIATFNVVHQGTQAEAEQLLYPESGASSYILLPHEPASEFWEYTNAPWWEFAVVFDKYDGFIKAPRHGKDRSNEPTAEEIDEQLDHHEENQGKVRVLSPSTLKLWLRQGVQENYLERMRRI